MHRQLHVVTLLGMGRDTSEPTAQVIRSGCVKGVPTTPGRTASDEDGVGEQRASTRGRVPLEHHRGVEVAAVESIKVDLEDAPDVRLVVRKVVERHAVHLDRAVVPFRVALRRGVTRWLGERNRRGQPDQRHRGGHDRQPLPQPLHRAPLFGGPRCGR